MGLVLVVVLAFLNLAVETLQKLLRLAVDRLNFGALVRLVVGESELVEFGASFGA